MAGAGTEFTVQFVLVCLDKTLANTKDLEKLLVVTAETVLVKIQQTEKVSSFGQVELGLVCRFISLSGRYIVG